MKEEWTRPMIGRRLFNPPQSGIGRLVGRWSAHDAILRREKHYRREIGWDPTAQPILILVSETKA